MGINMDGRGVESQICIHGVFREIHTQYRYIVFPVAVLCCYHIFYVLFEFSSIKLANDIIHTSKKFVATIFGV